MCAPRDPAFSLLAEIGHGVDALEIHPAYKRLHSADALFHDPATGGPAIQNLWSSATEVSANGSWVDLTAKEGRQWWYEGVKGLVDLGVDAMWE